ncbi:MAG: cobalamin biosynthesis protein CbiX [Candidatus Thiodiazotropha sp. (ex Ctena orbiculata)]|nr:cobalamin biosynthesis protein CbiX [Candidatus Thiodiazotropha taylori]MBV2108500.1 cobalamin biosynthesis protein CbiX [Candidatus Thiodiazotropha taylori]
MDNPLILLLDNGSVEPESTRNLRRLARELGLASGHTIHSVSLQHADRIAAEALDGRTARTLQTFLGEQLRLGVRDFLAIPLFFGPSRSLSAFVPDLLVSLQSAQGPFKLHLADPLYPLPEGESRLARILRDQIDPLISQSPKTRVVLVDHGSPQPAVTEVRLRIAEELHAMLPSGVAFHQAVMERRKGKEYDFNGELLEQVLENEAQQGIDIPIILSLLFISPGRHAGEGGDIVTICSDAQRRHPGLKIHISQLVGEHPYLIEILCDRLYKGLSAAQEA